MKTYKTTGNRTEYSYYHCTNGKGVCSKYSVTEENVSKAIASKLESLHVDPDFLEWLNGSSGTMEGTGKDKESAASISRQGTIESARRRLRNLLNAKLDDPDQFSAEEFKAEKSRLNAEIAQLEAHESATKERSMQAKRSIVNAAHFVASARQRFTTGCPEARRKIALQLAESYYLTLENLEIRLHPLLVPFATIEPAKSGSGSSQSALFDTPNPTWCAAWDDLRTLIIEQDLSFPAWEADNY